MDLSVPIHEARTILYDVWEAVVLFFQNVNLADMVRHHPKLFYTVTFVWSFLQGETFVLFAGAAAAKGIVDVKILFLATWLGTFCGDQLYFYVGRKFGPALLHRYPKLEQRADKVFKRIMKYEIPFIMIYRFLYGIRNISPFAIGLSGLSWQKFTFWNFLASALCAFAFVMAGYVFGEAVGKSLGSTVETVMIGLAGVVAVVLLAKYVWKKYKAHT
jgi:membrane protein DedA with SNARE-associated domain